MSPPNPLFNSTTSVFTTAKLLEELVKPQFRLRHTDLSKYTIINWEKEGLISLEREGTERKRFSFIDYVWLQIVVSFRVMNTPMPLIKKLQGHLFENISMEGVMDMLRLNPEMIDKMDSPEEREIIRGYIDGDEVSLDNTSFSYLALLITEFIATRVPVTLVLFSDGSFFPWYGKEGMMAGSGLFKIFTQTHTSIPLTDIILGFLKKEDSAFALAGLGLLTENEAKLLETIRSGKYDAITIHFKDAQMQSMELKLEQDVRRKMVDILADSSYQDIIVKKHNGKITRIQNTKKVVF